jgi:hypothetical protein
MAEMENKQEWLKKQLRLVRCGDCRHYKDRYTLFLHGGFPTLRRLLELNLIDERDFLCEGWGCIYHPCEDLAHDKFGIPIMEDEFPAIECEMFEPRKKRRELAKNIYKEQYRTKRAIDAHKQVKHLDISKIKSPHRLERRRDSGSYKL